MRERTILANPESDAVAVALEGLVGVAAAEAVTMNNTYVDNDTDGDTDATTVECVFSLGGRDIDPDLITQELGVAPTNIWRQRRPNLAARTDLPNVAWEFSSGACQSDNIEEPIERTLDGIRPGLDKVKGLAARLNLRTSMTVIVQVRSNAPLYAIGPATLASLGEIGTELSLDIADLRPVDGAGS
jgi:hypothetical protein